MWGNWGLYGNFATNMNYYGGENVGTQICDTPTLEGKCGNSASGKARGDWEQVVFSLD